MPELVIITSGVEMPVIITHFEFSVLFMAIGSMHVILSAQQF